MFDGGERAGEAAIGVEAILAQKLGVSRIDQ